MALVPYKRQKKAAAAPSTVALVFPSGTPKFQKPSIRERYAELQEDKTIIPTPSVCLSAMLELRIFEEVDAFLRRSGLTIFMQHEKLETYEIPTREFVASVLTYEKDGEKGWKFQLGGRTFELSYAKLRGILKFPEGGIRKKLYTTEEKDAFWLEISGMSHFCPLMHHTNIKSGTWKYLHRIVASGINTRKDKDRFVNGFDMNLLMMIREGVIVDWLDCLDEMFKEWQDAEGENKAIGGGGFVTLIATHLRFDMSTAGRVIIKPLDIKQLVQCKDLMRDKKTWTHDPNMHDRAKKTIEIRLKAEAKRSKKRKGKGVAEPEEQVEKETDAEPSYVPQPDFDIPPHPSIEAQLSQLGERMTTLEVDHAIFTGKSYTFMNRIEDKVDWLIERSYGHDAPAPPPRGHYGSSSGRLD